MTTNDVIHDGVPLFVALPEETPTAGVVLLQEAFGLTDHMKDVAERFTREGFVVAAPNLFHRQPQQVFAYEDVSTAKAAIATLHADELISDVRAAVSWLTSVAGSSNRITSVGFCFGGKVSFLAATAIDQLDGCAVFYGSGIANPEDPTAPVDRASSIDCPVLVFYGESDALISPTERELVRVSLQEAGVPYELVLYNGGKHGFMCDARPTVFDQIIAADAWLRVVGFVRGTAVITGQSFLRITLEREIFGS